MRIHTILTILYWIVGEYVWLILECRYCQCMHLCSVSNTHKHIHILYEEVENEQVD